MAEKNIDIQLCVKNSSFVREFLYKEMLRSRFFLAIHKKQQQKLNDKNASLIDCPARTQSKISFHP